MSPNVRQAAIAFFNGWAPIEVLAEALASSDATEDPELVRFVDISLKWPVRPQDEAPE